MSTPAQHRADTRRRTIRVERTATARQTFAGLAHGCEVYVLTHGQFSLIDALAALLETTGPARATISTWSAAHVDLEHAARFLERGDIISVRFLVDRSFATRQPAYCATLRRLYGDDAIRTTRSHAKFATLRNDSWDLAIRTSMNLNENPRLENIEVSDDRVLCDFLDGEVDRFFAEPAGDFNGQLPIIDIPPATPVAMGRKIRTGLD